MRQFALRSDGTAVGEHDVLGNSQSEARAAGFPGASLINTIEALEQAGQVLRRNTGAEIPDVEFDATLGGART